MQSTNSPTEIHHPHLPDMQPALTNEALRNEDREPVHLLWRKCPSISSLCGGGKVATQPPDLTVERLVISHGKILNTSKSQIQQPER
jgi:hypothetical protein